MTDFQPGPFGPFFLLHRVAVGSTAEVFAALDHRPDGTGDMVALKRFPRGSALAVETWNHEQRIHGLLRHGSVPRLVGVGESDGHPWLAQEWVQGKSLRQLQRKLTKSRHKLSMELGVHITLEVCKALDCLHRASDGRPLELVHCDISPGNVLLGYDGSVKLTDFGDVVRVGTALDPNVERPPGQLRYMSPEQALHEPLSQRSDLFSLGVVLHELLTGQLLFPDGVEPIIELRVRNTPVDAPSLSNPAVPKELDRAVVTALEPSHLKRHGSIRAFWMALDEIAEDVIARTGPEVLAKVMEIVFNREMELEEQLLRAALSQAGIDLEPDERVLRVEPVTTLGERPPPEPPAAPRPPTHAPPVYSAPPAAPTYNPPPPAPVAAPPMAPPPAPTPTIAPPRLITQPPPPSGRTDPGQRNDPRWSSPARQRGNTAPGEGIGRAPPPPVFGVSTPSFSGPSPLSSSPPPQPAPSQPALSPQRGPRAAAPPLSLVAAHTMYGGGGGGGSLSDDQLPTQFASIDLDDEDDLVEPDEPPTPPPVAPSRAPTPSWRPTPKPPAPPPAVRTVSPAPPPPAAPPKIERRPPPPPEPSATRSPDTGTLLLADSDAELREMLVGRLRSLGYAVEEAADGEQALSRLARGGIDVALLDLRLPRLDAARLLHRLRQQTPAEELPVLVLGTSDRNPELLRALAEGANDYALKGGDVEVLAARLRNLTLLRRTALKAQQAVAAAAAAAANAAQGGHDAEPGPEFSFDLSPDGRFRDLSAAGVAALGYPAEQLLGRPLFDLVHQQDAAVLRRDAPPGHPLPDAPTVLFRFKRPDGRHIWLEVQPRKNPDPRTGGLRGVWCIGQDVSKRVEGQRAPEPGIAVSVDDRRERARLTNLLARSGYALVEGQEGALRIVRLPTKSG